MLIQMIGYPESPGLISLVFREEQKIVQKEEDLLTWM
jgi:hypothetical protein